MPGTPGASAPELSSTTRSGSTAPNERLPAWATALISSALFGALYLILYQAAEEYYRHLGITPDEAGFSRNGVAGGALEFVLVLAVLLIPGVLLAVALFRLRAHLLAVDLDKVHFDRKPSPWNTVPQPLPADKATC